MFKLIATSAAALSLAAMSQPTWACTQYYQIEDYATVAVRSLWYHNQDGWVEIPFSLPVNIGNPRIVSIWTRSDPSYRRIGERTAN
jgi:hypothetical protein